MLRKLFGFFGFLLMPCLGFSVIEISRTGEWYQSGDIFDNQIQWDCRATSITSGNYAGIEVDKIGEYQSLRVSTNVTTGSAVITAYWKDPSGTIRKTETLTNNLWYVNKNLNRVEIRITKSVGGTGTCTGSIIFKRNLVVSYTIPQDSTGTEFFTATNPGYTTEVSAAEMLAVMKQVSANIKLTNDRLDFISANILANTAQLVTLNMEYYWTVAFSVTVNNTPTSCTLTNNEIVVRVFNCGVTDTVWAETNAAAVHGKCTPIVAGPNGLYLTAGKSSDYFSIVGPNKGVWTRIEKGRKEPW